MLARAVNGDRTVSSGERRPLACSVRRLAERIFRGAERLFCEIVF
jgi:hypothetical protein